MSFSTGCHVIAKLNFCVFLSYRNLGKSGHEARISGLARTHLIDPSLRAVPIFRLDYLSSSNRRKEFAKSDVRKLRRRRERVFREKYPTDDQLLICLLFQRHRSGLYSFNFLDQVSASFFRCSMNSRRKIRTARNLNRPLRKMITKT